MLRAVSSSGGGGTFTTITATGAITPSSTAGIVGTTTNDNANAGSDGEYISSQIVAASQISLTSGTAANVTSISLTAGDWNVNGNVVIVGSSGTSLTTWIAAIGSTSATLPTAPNNGAYSLLTSAAIVATTQALNVGPTRISLASPATIYLLAQATFTVNTAFAYGAIAARRVR